MAATKLPSRDPEVMPFVTNFCTYAAANAVALGITPAQVTEVQSLGSDFDEALTTHNAAVIAAKTARGGKDNKKKILISGLRDLIKQIVANPNLTVEQRLALGLGIPDSSRSPVPPPASRPDPDVKDIDELTHVLRFVDSISNKAAKPEGVDAAEVYLAVVEPGDPAPADISQYQFAGLATRSTWTREFAAADANKMAYYKARWVNAKGQYGAFGNTVAATIAA